MQLKKTLVMVGKLQLILLLMIFLLAVRYAEWVEGGQKELILFIFFFEFQVIIVALASLFSKENEDEGKLETSIKEAPLSIHLISWTIVIAYSSIFVLFTVAPFPSAIVFVLSFFSWAYALIGIFSHRIVVMAMAAIVEDKKDTFLNDLSRYLTSIHFYAVYTMFSRTSSLPWYVRKPIALIIFFGWMMIMFATVGLFDR